MKVDANPVEFWGKRVASILAVFALCYLIDLLTGHFFAQYQQRLVILAGLYVTLAVSLNMINGITGQFSIGHAAFYQVGAYTAGFLVTKMINPGNFPPLVLLVLMAILGAIVAAIMGLVVGLPSLRLRGDYLAIVTLGFGEILRILVQNTPALGGSYGMNVSPKIQSAGLVWLLAFVCIAVCRNLLKTAHGLPFLAVREDEIASSAMGVNVTRVKVTAFVIGSLFAGAAGGMQAHFEGFLSPASYAMDVSFIILTMVVLGGTGSITGSVIAAILLSYLPEYLRDLKAPLTGGTVLAGFLIVFGAVALIKTLMNAHRGTAKQRTLTYFGIAIGGIILIPVIGSLLNFIPSLSSLTIEASKLRMVIFAVALIVLMLLRPEGIFGHHEFSWNWLKTKLGKKPVKV